MKEEKTNNPLIVKTFEGYVKIAKEMKESQNYNLDLSQYSPDEAYIIANLVKSDSIFSFFEKVKNVDIKKLVAIMKYCDAKEEMENAIHSFNN